MIGRPPAKSPTNRDVFQKTSPQVTLSHMNDMLTAACGSSEVCIMNALMSKDDAMKRCEKYKDNADGSKCSLCIMQWLND